MGWFHLDEANSLKGHTNGANCFFCFLFFSVFNQKASPSRVDVLPKRSALQNGDGLHT